MANAYGLTPGDVDKAQSIVVHHRDNFKNIGTHLFSEVEHTQHGFQGQAATAFRALHRTWQDKQQVIINILNAFHDGLDSTKKHAIEQETNALDGVKQAERQLDSAQHGHLHMRLG